MVKDELITIRDSFENEIPLIIEMEQAEENNKYIHAYNLIQHQEAFVNPDILYKSICTVDNKMIGFFLLALDPDGKRVELRRIVVSLKGKGFGNQVIKMIDEICVEELNRRTIWLDVFEDNQIAISIYEKQGYSFQKNIRFKSDVLRIYQKEIIEI